VESPVFVGELELTNPVADILLPKRADGLAYNGAYLLVRLDRMPVGYAFLAPDALDSAEIARQVWDQLSIGINEHYARAGLPAVDTLPASGLVATKALEDGTSDRPLISVVVCTRNRPDGIMVTLRSLLAMHYRPFEIVVIDNAPSSGITKDAVLNTYGEDPRIRYVREPRPGLSCARNRGLREASADIIAFTDDDVTVDRWWLDGILRGFHAAPDVACVTGVVGTAQLENAVQLYFHLGSAWGAVRGSRIFDLAENRDASPLYPFCPGIIGAGANFAVSRALMKEIGGFDEALGAGTLSGGGEDLEIYMRILFSGNRIAHESAAIVWHYHRSELAELARQRRAYGTGLTAALAAIVLRTPQARRELPPRVLHGVLRIFTLHGRVKDNATLPRGLMGAEVGGMLMGPLLYLKGRRRIPLNPPSERADAGVGRGP
jgi:GT2 family glycosyltransferase